MILHIEDEPQQRTAIAMLLNGSGYWVSSAASGAEALRSVAQGLRPDVLIVDFNLEAEMNGAEAAERIRQCLGYTPPIIMLTGDPSNATLPWITDAPIWLAHKSADPQVLVAAMPSLIQLSRAIRDLIGVAARRRI